MNGSTMMAAGAGKLLRKVAIAGRKSSFIFKADLPVQASLTSLGV
jgi:hypothetical protein